MYRKSKRKISLRLIKSRNPNFWEKSGIYCLKQYFFSGFQMIRIYFTSTFSISYLHISYTQNLKIFGFILKKKKSTLIYLKYWQQTAVHFLLISELSYQQGIYYSVLNRFLNYPCILHVSNLPPGKVVRNIIGFFFFLIFMTTTTFRKKCLVRYTFVL